MRVICVDKLVKSWSKYPEDLLKLKEGGIYNAVQSIHPEGYYLHEVQTKCKSGFWKGRFIELSEIDELELVNNLKETV